MLTQSRRRVTVVPQSASLNRTGGRTIPILPLSWMLSHWRKHIDRGEVLVVGNSASGLTGPDGMSADFQLLPSQTAVTRRARIRRSARRSSATWRWPGSRYRPGADPR